MARMTVDDEIKRRRRDACLEACKQETPTFLVWVGLMIVALEVVNYVVPPQEALASYLRTAALGAAFSLLGVSMRRPSFPSALVPWAFVSCAALLAALLLLDFRSDERPPNLAWIVTLLLFLGPATGVFRPFAVAGGLIYGAFVWTLIALDVPHASGWILVLTASALASGVLLRRRLETLYELAEAREQVERLATTDRLTGVLNRHGLDAAVPALRATAERHGFPVFACFIDVRGLKAANDLHGHEFGDEVIRVVAGGVQACTRKGDNVARWGGDEFLIVGMGEEPKPQEIEARVRQYILGSGIDLVRWPGYVSAGCASAGAAALDVGEVIRLADAEMYRRRSEG